MPSSRAQRRGQQATFEESVGDFIEQLLCLCCCGLCNGLDELCDSICRACNPCTCIFLPAIGLVKGVITLPIVLLSMVLGTVFTVLLHLPKNLVMTYVTVCSTNQLGPTIKVLLMPVLAVPVLLWPPIAIVAAVWVSLMLGIFGPLVKQDWDPKVIQEKCAPESNQHCCSIVCSGVQETIGQAFTSLQDLWNWHFQTWFDELKDYRTRPTPPGGPFDIHIVTFFLGIIFGVVGMAVDGVAFTLVLLCKAPFIVAHYWQLLFESARQCCANDRCMAYGWWVCALPFYGVAFLFVPIVVILALPIALLRGLGTGLCVPLHETTSRRSIRTGFNSIYLNIVNFDREVNVDVYQQPDTCFPVCECCEAPQPLHASMYARRADDPPPPHLQQAVSYVPTVPQIYVAQPVQPAQQYQPQQAAQAPLQPQPSSAARVAKGVGSALLSIGAAAVAAGVSIVQQQREQQRQQQQQQQQQLQQPAQAPVSSSPPAYNASQPQPEYGAVAQTAASAPPAAKVLAPVPPPRHRFGHRLSQERIWDAFYAQLLVEGKAALDRGWITAQDIHNEERWLQVGLAAGTVLQTFHRSIRARAGGFLLHTGELVNEYTRPDALFARRVYLHMCETRAFLESAELNDAEWQFLEKFTVVAGANPEVEDEAKVAGVRDPEELMPLAYRIRAVAVDLGRAPSFHRRYSNVMAELYQYASEKGQGNAALTAQRTAKTMANRVANWWKT